MNAPPEADNFVLCFARKKQSAFVHPELFNLFFNLLLYIQNCSIICLSFLLRQTPREEPIEGGEEEKAANKEVEKREYRSQATHQCVVRTENDGKQY